MISVCCPSRSRPDFAARLCKNVRETAGGKVEVLFYIDSDDPTLPEYQKLCPDARLVVGERHVLGTLYNRLWKESKGNLLLLIGDDMYFATMGWAKKVEEAYDRYLDKICFITGSKHPSFIGPTYLFVSRRACEVLGYFAPPWLNRWIDTWLWEIARNIGRGVVVDIYVEHVHPSTGGRSPDAVFLNLQSTATKDQSLFSESKHVRQFDEALLRRGMLREGLVLM
jgi:hypothetical protein